MRRVQRPRRYVANHWLILMTPVLRYSSSRDAYVLRGLGNRMGPVLRVDRRSMQRRRLDGPERRSPHAA
jgi:hypothetical protein